MILTAPEIQQLEKALDFGPPVFRFLKGKTYTIWPQFTNERKRKGLPSALTILREKNCKIRGRELTSKDCKRFEDFEKFLRNNRKFQNMGEWQGFYMQTTYEEMVNYQEKLEVKYECILNLIAGISGVESGEENWRESIDSLEDSAGLSGGANQQGNSGHSSLGHKLRNRKNKRIKKIEHSYRSGKENQQHHR